MPWLPETYFCAFFNLELLLTLAMRGMAKEDGDLGKLDLNCLGAQDKTPS